MNLCCDEIDKNLDIDINKYYILETVIPGYFWISIKNLRKLLSQRLRSTITKTYQNHHHTVEL